MLVAFGPGPKRAGVDQTLALAGVEAPQRRRLVATMLQDLVDRGVKHLKPKALRLKVEGSPSVSTYLPLLKLRGLSLDGPDPMSCFLHSARREGKDQVTVGGHFVLHQQAGLIMRYDLVRSQKGWVIRSRNVVGEI